MVSLTSQPIAFKRDDIIVLLGAGASVDAGIPHSATMVQRIEEAIKPSEQWSAFGDLYNYVRSAIYFAEGIRGRFDSNVSYNIERVVEALNELGRRMDHPLYPFVGAWNPRLIQVAGAGFEEVDKFKDKIVERLRREWIEIPNYEKAKYYEGLFRFQKQLTHPLRVFSLNYDLCVEKISQMVANELPECGFDEQREWRYQLFEDGEGKPRRVVLYKLHGSIDWRIDSKTNRLTFSDSTSGIKPEETALIFGTSYKLQYLDPFLFLVYEFRRCSLDAKLLILVGYGFGDEHVNGIVRQAIRNQKQKRLVVVAPLQKSTDPSEAEKTQAVEQQKEWIRIKLQLELDDRTRIHVIDATAKSFFETSLQLEEMAKLFPAEEPDFSELK